MKECLNQILRIKGVERVQTKILLRKTKKTKNPRKRQRLRKLRKRETTQMMNLNKQTETKLKRTGIQDKFKNSQKKKIIKNLLSKLSNIRLCLENFKISELMI